MKTIQLFCLPYAGGGADFFDVLRDHLDDNIVLDAFEYAGHGKRLKEPTYADFGELAEDACQYINGRLLPDCDWMLFGYSMGTIGAYEMLAHGGLLRAPKHVFLASHEAPDGHWESKGYQDMSDEGLWKAMKQYGGFDRVDDKMMRNRFFRRLYFAPLRADYRLLGNYPANHRGGFDMDVTVLYSLQDIPEDKVHGWDSFFHAGREYIELGDNHFFLKTCAEQTAGIINRVARKLV
ncbi:MAG: thioesterase domain-containing protein [Eubacteriales bacterium]|nr:thioesterase domain-containing protein [Eubacteriales bacterium]